MTRRRYLIAAVLAVAIPILAISYGCSGSGENRDAAVASALATYLGGRGEVGSCSDAQFTQDGLDLFMCVVYPASDPDSAQTWNVSVNSSNLVTDASPQ
jgi:hypothetical protein